MDRRNSAGLIRFRQRLNVTHRHDISDADWKQIAPLLLGQPGQHGGVAEDTHPLVPERSICLDCGHHLHADYTSRRT